MKLIDLKVNFHEQLDAIYGKDEVESIFFICTKQFADYSKLQLALQPDLKLSDSEYTSLLAALKRLKAHEPVQYILGETEFFGLVFKVNKHVLIPRQETEELVNWILNTVRDNNSKSELKVLDIGTGSGCIAVSLAKHLPQAQVYALDLSDIALNLANENAHDNGVKVEFIKADILNLEESTQHYSNINFDIIVSNPPYVRHSEKIEIQPNVLDFEPHLALFVEDKDPLIFYRNIVEFAKRKLHAKGYLYFEINQYLGEETKAVLHQSNFKSIELRQDLNANDRMIRAKIEK